MTRGRWAAAIFAAWVVSLAWLVKRELFRPTGALLAEAALRVPPGAVYYRLAVAGRQVGFSSTTIDTPGATIRVTDVLVLQVPALGRLYRTSALSRATLSRALRLEGVAVRFDGEPGRFGATGLVMRDSVLAVAMDSGADSQATRVPLRGPAVLPSILPLRLAFGGVLRPGKVYTLMVFDPMLLAERPVEVTVAAESTFVVPDSAGFDSTAMAWVPVRFDTVRAFRIEARSGGPPTSAWIDAQGHIVEAVSPVGFTMERTAFELAYTNFRHRDTARVARASLTPGPGELIATTALAAHVGPPKDTVALLRVHVTGAVLGGPDVATGRQELRGDTLVVRRAGPTELAARYALPAREPRLAAFVAPEPLVQSDDGRVRAQARFIVGEERDPARAARLLADWVRAHLVRGSAPGFPGAARVLDTRRGDCNEHTVLYVALARAAGLPARAVAGLLEIDGRFYYHAWPEVYLGDWVGVDPMLGQFPADAAHLRFVVGGLAHQAQLVRVLGGLHLEVL